MAIRNPSNCAAEIEREKQQRLKRKRINEILSRAQSLLAALQEDECLVLLAQGLQEYPQEPEFLKMQEMANAESFLYSNSIFARNRPHFVD